MDDTLLIDVHKRNQGTKTIIPFQYIPLIVLDMASVYIFRPLSFIIPIKIVLTSVPGF